MTEADKHDAGACKAGCGGCAIEPADAAGGPAGWRLVAAAAGIFLLPLALAVGGAALAGPGGAAQLLGAIVGLAAGVGAAAIVGKILRTRANDNTPSPGPLTPEDK